MDQFRPLFSLFSSFQKIDKLWGCGGGQVVSVLAFYSNDPSLNPAEAYSFSVKYVFEKNNKQKEAGVHEFF